MKQKTDYKGCYYISCEFSGGPYSIDIGTISEVNGIQRFIEHIIWMYKTNNRISMGVLIAGDLLDQIREINYEN